MHAPTRPRPLHALVRPPTIALRVNVWTDGRCVSSQCGAGLVPIPSASSYHEIFAVIEAREMDVQALKGFLASMGCARRARPRTRQRPRGARGMRGAETIKCCERTTQTRSCGEPRAVH